MIKSSSPALARKLLAALGLSLLFSLSVLADTAYVTTFTGGSLTLCTPYCVNPLGLTGVSISSAGSTAIANPPGVPSRTKAAYGFAGAVNWSLTPTLGQAGGVYTIEEAHQANISSDSADIVMNAFSSDGKVSSGCTNTTVFQKANGGDVWKLIGYITNNPGVTQPTIIFHYVSGTVNNTGTGRVYIDAFRFVLADPCYGVAGDVAVVGPLAAGQTTVNVSGVVAGATNVTVYANGNPVGMNVNLGGFAAGTVAVTTSALAAHDQITARQYKNGCVGNLSSAAATGGGANPTLQVTLEVGKLAGLTGPIGAGAGGSGAPVYWVHANGRRSFSFGVAPTGGYTITPSTNWVTLTFNSDTDDVYNWSGNVFPYVNTDPYAVLEGLGLAIDDNVPDIGPFNIYIDSIYNGSTLIQGFEGHPNGTYGVMFLRPGASTTPSGMIYSSPDTNFVNNAGGVNSDTGTNSLNVQWEFKSESADNWVRLYSGGTGTPYPQIDLHQPVTVRMLVLPVGQTIGRRFDGNVSFLTNSSPTFYTSGSNTLGASITGSGTYTYQWSHNGTDIGGATDASYQIEPFSGISSPADKGLYSLTVTDEGNGSIVRSINVFIITDPVPAITNQPAALTTAHVGDNVTWTVGGDGHVEGGYPLSYQWRFNGANITDATDASFTTNNVQVANAGTYSVAVNNSFGSVTSSPAILNVVQPAVVVGTGTGLRGDYFTLHTSANPFSGAPTLTRTDPTVNYNWGTGSPDPSISADTFTVRWSGQVQALDTDTYTFYVKCDDGQRLWVNGQQLVNDWVLHGPTEKSGTIALTANVKYDIVMEYFENLVGAAAQLSWSGASGGVVKEIIPASQLYPASAVAKPSLGTAFNNGTNLVFSWGAGTYTLQSATVLTGPFTTVTNGVVSPYTNVIDPLAPQKFFRLQVQ
ncbi:MAG: hypothetical protein QOJ40_1043 [Verrucomicrobiota bacterium]